MHHLSSQYIPCDGRLTASAYFKSTLPVGGATPGSLRGTSQSGISIHAPRMGSDHCRCRSIWPSYYFNPRSPHGERRMLRRHIQNGIKISIHAPRMGSDRRQWARRAIRIIFQSTLPAWGATEIYAQGNAKDDISIHAPRMGSDFFSPCLPRGMGDFNPRSPHGERLQRTVQRQQSRVFQSTLPAWGATPARGNTTGTSTNFNPRSPHGERLSIAGSIMENIAFQSTLPAWGATLTGLVIAGLVHISIHAPRMGSDTVRH